MTETEQQWAACRSLLLHWDDDDYDEKIGSDELKEVNGRMVTKAEAALLECYALEAAEAARQQQRIAATAPQKVTTTTKILDLAPPKQPTKVTKGPIQLGGMTAAALASAAAASKRAAAATERVSEIPAKASESVSVPKRAKKSSLLLGAFSVDVATPDPVDARAVGSADGLPEEGLVRTLANDSREPPWESWKIENLEVTLPNFISQTGNQTAVLTVSIESEAERWALNVLPPDHDESSNIWFHFNPRRRERGGELVLNDKNDSDWGKVQRVPLSKLPSPLFGLDNAELAFQFEQSDQETTVYVALNRRPIVSWTLRTDNPPSPGSDIVLQAPRTDDFGNDEQLTIHSLWWGFLPQI